MTYQRIDFPRLIEVPQTVMTPVEAAEAFEGILDGFSVGAAWSIRRLLSSYTGPGIRIRASGDDEEEDFGFDGVGDLDTAAIDDFITTHGGSGFIVTWYDQSGNGFDISEAVEANQPLYVASGINSKPTVRFDGSNDTLIRASVSSSVFTGEDEVTTFLLYKPDSTGPDGVILNYSGGGGADFNIMDIATDLYFDFAGTGAGGRINATKPGGWDDNPHVWECFRMASDDNQEMLVDGVSLVSATRTDVYAANSGTFRLSAAGNMFKGDLSETIVLKVGEDSTDRTTIRGNLGAYYGISV